MTHVHLIGIGGTGLSAIARVLLERGDTVSGSDSQPSPLVQSAQEAGARVVIGHRSENIAGADLVVCSSAIPDDNVEIQAAHVAGIPVFKRSEFIGRLLKGHQVVAVAGTHGKTTTTAMIAWMLHAMEQDPSYIIGGVSENLKTNAHAGQGTIFVIEADEYDRMFLGLDPAIAVVTNVEHDHPDCYPTPQDFYQAFRQFVGRLTSDGTLIACVDDLRADGLMQEAIRDGIRTRSYGMKRRHGQSRPDYFAHDLSPGDGADFTFEAEYPSRGDNDKLLTVNVALQVPGRFNVLNALAALAVADVLMLPVIEAARVLGEFRGTNRRFEVRGEVKDIIVIDDYAHHPTEIRATLSAARERYPRREIWAVWQPHTYSRARMLFDEYTISFNDADHVMITNVYAAREPAPTNGFSARQIVEVMSHPDVQFVADLDRAADILANRLSAKDVLLVLSAGDADQISSKVLKAIQDS